MTQGLWDQNFMQSFVREATKSEMTMHILARNCTSKPECSSLVLVMEGVLARPAFQCTSQL
jgi:hypothetical protein